MSIVTIRKLLHSVTVSKLSTIATFTYKLRLYCIHQQFYFNLMEFDLNQLTNTYLWSTFSKPSQDTSLLMRMNCNQKTGNTQTKVRQDGSNIVDVFLYDNLICSYDPSNYENQKVKLYSGNHYTKTTKDRLNAILYLHTNNTVRIKQVRKKWIVTDTKTDTEINFYEGMIIFQNILSLAHVSNDTQMEVEWTVA